MISILATLTQPFAIGASSGNPVGPMSILPEVATTRIEEFSDGVFSIVITLLILNMAIPNIPHELAATKLLPELIKLFPKFYCFVLTFIVIGIYWVAHHNIFMQIKKSDRVLMWLNNIFLMFVTFLPFPANLLGQYWDQQISIIVYGVSLIAVSLSLAALWFYASHNHRLVGPEMNPCFRRIVNYRICLTPTLSLLAIGFSFFNITLSLMIYAITTALHFIPNRIFTNQHIFPGQMTCQQVDE